MNILVLTSNYPASDLPKEITPVVHYFTREWIKVGVNVLVVHNQTVFPQAVYLVLRHLKRFLANKAGFIFAADKPVERDYRSDGVPVFRRNICKLLPRTPFLKSSYNRMLREIGKILDENDFEPDIILGHWLTPQLYLLHELKHKYPSATTVLTVHEGRPVLERDYGEKGELYLKSIDRICFRSRNIKDTFMGRHHIEIPTFICYSGVPQKFFSGGSSKNFDRKMTRFTFVGTLIERKHPEAIIKALQGYGCEGLSIDFIGEGKMAGKLMELSCSLGMEEYVHLHGRIDRKDVAGVLSQTDCFVMISQEEAFGLVYLEAMANGCLTVASRHEGMDGIIHDGENGFLCTAGDWKELRGIIDRINGLSPEDKQRISEAAVKTSQALTDAKVAENYLNFMSTK